MKNVISLITILTFIASCSQAPGTKMNDANKQDTVLSAKTIIKNKIGELFATTLNDPKSYEFVSEFVDSVTYGHNIKEIKKLVST